METVHGFAAAQNQRVPRLTSSHTQLSPVDSAVPNALQPTAPSPLLPATVHTEYPLPCPHSPLFFSYATWVLFFFPKLLTCGSWWMIYFLYHREPSGLVLISQGSEVRFPELKSHLQAA